MDAIQREKMVVDVVLVGAGVASLATAYQLIKRVNEHNQKIDAGQITGEKIGPLEIAILEKTSEVGHAVLSGAVMDPRGIDAVIPDWKEKGAPFESKVTGDATYFFTKNRALKFPVNPPPLRQHGNYVVSLSKLTRWFADRVKNLGVNIFEGFAGRELIYDDAMRVIGVRTDDKGIGKNGERKANFSPGIDIMAKIVVLGEGVRGNLTRDHIWKLGLDKNANPPSFGTGVKEVWEILPENFPQGGVWHTMGFPQRRGVMGGGWVYGMGANQVSLGFVTWLSYADPFTDPHKNFQKFKSHPAIKKILAGGKMVQYGAKAVSVGGYYSIPKSYGDGWMIVGEAANMVDGQRLKGIHLAFLSGQMAGDAAFTALQQNDYSESTLSKYKQLFENHWIKKELMLSRNFHQAFENGFLMGLVRTGIQQILKGRDLFGYRLKSHKDVSHMKKISEFHGSQDAKIEVVKFDNAYLYDKLTDVYNAGSMHEEDQPSHLVVADTNLCVERCSQEYGNPCNQFCPAQVYEMEEKNGLPGLKLNPSNCVHCKTCDIMDPYDNIRWVVPEGGGGPRYTIM